MSPVASRTQCDLFPDEVREDDSHFKTFHLNKRLQEEGGKKMKL